MKTYIFIFFIVITLVAYALEVNISSFNAVSDSKVITIEWRTNDETNVKSYEIERASGQIFTKIATINANGFPSSYKYIDDNALMVANNSNNNSALVNTKFSYRIKIIGKQPNTYQYSNTINVNHSVSSIRKTWGMLKEMFR